MKEVKYNVAIIEDLKDIAVSLQSFFNSEDDMQCNNVYHNAEDAILFIPQSEVNIVLVDIGLPRASGIEAIQQIKAKCPNMLFCMFTVYEDDEKIFRSLQAGAIRELAEGGSPMSPTIARKIIDSFKDFKLQQVQKELPLTCREIELLHLLAKGMLYKEIANQLHITVGTVKQHIHKIYDKLQVNNKTEAINKMNTNGQS